MPPDKHAAVVAELEKLKPMATAFEGLKTEFASAQTAWSEERAGLSVGLDAEGLSVARLVYGSLPADKRPAFDAFLAAEKAAPRKAMTPWFAPPAAVVPPPTPGAAAVPPPVPPPALPPPALPPPGGASESVDAIIEQAKKTGDWSKYNAIRHTLIRPAR